MATEGAGVPAEEPGLLAAVVLVALLGILAMVAMVALRAVGMVALQPQAPAAVAAVALEERQLLLFPVLKVAAELVFLDKVAMGLLAHIYKVLAALVALEQRVVAAVHTEGGRHPLAAALALQEQLVLVAVDCAMQTMFL